MLGWRSGGEVVTEALCRLVVVTVTVTFIFDIQVLDWRKLGAETARLRLGVIGGGERVLRRSRFVTVVKAGKS